VSLGSFQAGFGMAISLEGVRRRILIALFSDDELMDTLVLKGGNALALIYKVGSRASIDMDFSIQSAFSDVEKTGTYLPGSQTGIRLDLVTSSSTRNLQSSLRSAVHGYQIGGEDTSSSLS